VDNVRTLAKDRRLFNHPCFATRLGGVLGGKENQEWRDSSHTAIVGAEGIPSDFAPGFEWEKTTAPFGQRGVWT
jgi:hypothetical protein